MRLPSPLPLSFSPPSTSKARQRQKRALRTAQSLESQEQQQQQQQYQQQHHQQRQQQQQEQELQEQEQLESDTSAGQSKLIGQPQHLENKRFFAPDALSSEPVAPFLQSQLATPPSYPSIIPSPSSLSPSQSFLRRFPVQYPVDEPQPTPLPPGSDEEDTTWLVIIVLTTALIITIVTVIRSCGQKAGWLTGSPSTSPSSSTTGRGGANGSASGRGGRGGRGYGPHHVPEWVKDPEATEERLANLSDTDRQAYDAAQAFQIVHPPNSVPTDISLSQYLSIQEKGVSAWEFEASYDHQLFVHDRTELSFFDHVACVQTNLPLPRQQEVYYWEVKMFEKSPNTVISVGVTTKPYPTTRLPGWNRQSVGYFSNNGQKHCNSLWSGHPYGPIYFEGDVVGCGYRPRNGTIFFTRNGKRIEDAYTGFGRTNLFPTVGATGPCVLHVNFGQSGFVFVEANVKKWGLAPASGSLAPPPAYGSELGSILLEASGSAFGSASASVFSSGTNRIRPILQSSSSRTQIRTSDGGGVRGMRHEDSIRGAAVGGNVQNGGGGRSSSPVLISLSNMSAPPPNYSSLDRFGHPRQESQEQDIDNNSVDRHTHDQNDDNDMASVSSMNSDESATLLLGDARLEGAECDIGEEAEEEEEEQEQERARGRELLTLS